MPDVSSLPPFLGLLFLVAAAAVVILREQILAFFKGRQDARAKAKADRLAMDRTRIDATQRYLLSRLDVLIDPATPAAKQEPDTNVGYLGDEQIYQAWLAASVEMLPRQGTLTGDQLNVLGHLRRDITQAMDDQRGLLMKGERPRRVALNHPHTRELGRQLGAIVASMKQSTATPSSSSAQPSRPPVADLGE